jgi:hypothetical protein
MDAGASDDVDVTTAARPAIPIEQSDKKTADA